MKKLLVAIGVLLVLFVGLVGFALYNAKGLVQHYKPTIESMASDTVGSDITFGAIGIKVFPRLGISLDNVTVASREMSNETVRLQNVTLRMKFLPLFRKRLHVTALRLNAPNLVMLLEEEGLRLAGLPMTPPAESAKEEPVSGQAETDIPIALDFNSISVRNGTLLVKDTRSGTEYGVEPIDFDASVNLARGNAMIPTLKGSLRALPDIEVTFEGKDLGYNLIDASMSFGDLRLRLLGSAIDVAGTIRPRDSAKTIAVTSEGIDVAKLEALFEAVAPTVSEYGLAGKVKPDIQFALAQDNLYTAAGAVTLTGLRGTVAGVALTGLSGELSVDANGQAQQVETGELTAALSGIPLTATAKLGHTNEGLRFDDLRIQAFSGTLEASAEMRSGEATPFTTKVQLENMSIAEIASALLPDSLVRLEGALRAVSADLKGNLDEAPLASLQGNASLELADGLLKDVNLAERILAAVTSLPFLAGTLLDAVPPEWRDHLDKDYTVLESVTGTFTVAEEKLRTSDLNIDGELFVLDVEGTVGFDTTLDLAATIHFNPEFSAALAEKVKELPVLYDAQNRLSFPVRIQGKTPELRVLPDMEKLLQGTVKKTITEEAGKLLDGFLGDKDEPEKSEDKNDRRRGLLDSLRRRPE